MKTYEALAAAVLALFLVALSLDGCAYDAAAAESDPMGYPTERYPTEIEEPCGVGDWAVAAGYPVYMMSFEELARTQAVAHELDSSPAPIVGFGRLQVNAWVKDGAIAAPCYGGDYVTFYLR